MLPSAWGAAQNANSLIIDEVMLLSAWAAAQNANSLMFV